MEKGFNLESSRGSNDVFCRLAAVLRRPIRDFNIVQKQRLEVGMALSR